MTACEGCGHGENSHRYMAGILGFCEEGRCSCPFYTITLPDPGDFGGMST